MRWFERLIVQRFLLLVFVLSAAVLAAAGLSLWMKAVTLDSLSKALDSLLKALAVIIGALWALNRYYSTRTDYPQLRVDLIHDLVPNSLIGGESDFGLFTYRLDIVNTGKTLLPVTGYRVELSNVMIHDAEVVYEPLHQWPSEGMHPASPIEPGSWGAISEAICCPKDVFAIQVFLEIELNHAGSWTWHRNVALKQTDQARSAGDVPALAVSK